LGDAVADGGVEKHFAVGREARTIFGTLTGIGEAAGFATGEGDDPEMRAPGVVGERDINGGEYEPAGVGRNGEVADTFEVHHVLKGEGALLSAGGNRG